MESHVKRATMKRVDPKSMGVFHLCSRFAAKLSSEGLHKRQYEAIRNEHGYPQVVPVNLMSLPY